MKMPTIILVRKEHFCASHRLFNPKFTDEENLRIYGPCSNKNGHGHDYHLEVYVSGSIDPNTGMVINLTDLKRIIKDEILDYVDHHNLNLDVPFLKDVIPTTENIAYAFWKVLDPLFPNETLKKIVLHETEKNFVEIVR